MSDVDVSISVDDRHKISEVIEESQKLGLHVDQRLDAIGVITGHIDASRVDALSQVTGVSKVEKSRQIDIGPPDNEVQ